LSCSTTIHLGRAMKAIDHLYGGLFVGLIYTSILLGAITIQVWKYFSKFSQDTLWTKVLVAFLSAGQMLNLVCLILLIWILSVEGHVILVTNPWNGSIYLFVTVISSVAVHSFFASRIAKMTKRPWATLIVVRKCCPA